MTFFTGGQGVGAAWSASLGRLGGAVALAAMVGVAGCHRNQTSAPPAGGQLKVEMGKATKLDPDAALRCFVHGQFVGMQTPPQCAQKNGVAPGALDVGLDQSGALAAGAGDTHLQPLSNTTSDNQVGDDNAVDDDSDPPVTEPPQASLAAPTAAELRVGDCLHFGRAGWRGAGQGVDLNACVHILFNARCVMPGQVVYGRWGGETLRLLPGRVEMSDDNRNFHPLVAQNPQDCSLPQI